MLIGFIDKIQNTGTFFWLGAIAGSGLILLIHLGLKKIFRRNIKRKRTRLFLNTIINWITLFILFTYFFTYFAKTSLLYKTLFVFGDTQITMILILTIIFSVILSVKFSKAIQEFILPIVYEKYVVDRGLQASVNTFFSYFIVSLAVIISLSSIGFNLNSLTVFASVLGVGIGFGLQNVMSNFISGLIILFERPIRVGDRIVVDGKIANVEEIKIRSWIGYNK